MGCTEGEADFSDHPTKLNGDVFDFLAKSSQSGMHCACHPGYTGLQCESKYMDCADYNHKCYHGGKCLLGLNDLYGNNQLFCDCNDAFNEHGVEYVGKYCEIPKTVTCDTKGKIFCVNGGYCKSDYENYPRRPCHCGPDHEGPHCEFDKGAVPECTLSCKNGGNCRRGIEKNMPGEEFLYDYWKKNLNYQYCECPDDFNGNLCEIQSDKCGEHHCFHGGECVTITEGSNHKHHCDCNRAHTKDVAYGGIFCQFESKNFCDTEEKENGRLFCLNGGECQQEGSHLGCICPSGFHGPICEYRDDDHIPEDEKCNLECENGGQCRKGAKETSWVNKFGPELSHLNVTHSNDFEHCVCPNGFIGLQCEHKIEVCPDNGHHVCLHGSTCIKDGTSCDCEAGSTSYEKLAGKFCQHQSTEICTKSGTDVVGDSKFAFCVNGGICTYNERRAQCNCTEAFYGPHCELLKQEKIQEQKDTILNDNDHDKNYIKGDNHVIHSEEKEATPSTVVNTYSVQKSSIHFELFAAIVTGSVAVTIGIAIFLRRWNHSRKFRMVEGAIRHADTSNQVLVPKEQYVSKRQRYQDFLSDPDIPNMEGERIRPTSSYHDFVFENVEII